MAFTQLTAALDNTRQLPSTPTKESGYSADVVKLAFDQNSLDIKSYINGTLLNELENNGSLSGYSGAKRIGIADRTEFHAEGETNTNIEDVLLYFRELIEDATTGTIGDNGIKTNMLDHTSGIQAVDTGAIRDLAVTNSKLAGGIESSKIASLDVAKLTGTITKAIADSILGSQSISASKLYGGILATQLDGDIPPSKLKNNEAIGITKGGTGSTTADGARVNLGAVKLTTITSPTFTWTSDATISGYGYKGTYSNASITASTSADVIFSDADLGNYAFAKTCSTDDGHLYIWCDTNNPTFSTAPTIRLFD